MAVGFQQIKTGPFPLLARIQTPAKTKTYRNSLQYFKTKFSFFWQNTHNCRNFSNVSRNSQVSWRRCCRWWEKRKLLWCNPRGIPPRGNVIRTSDAVQHTHSGMSYVPLMQWQYTVQCQMYIHISDAVKYTHSAMSYMNLMQCDTQAMSYMYLWCNTHTVQCYTCTSDAVQFAVTIGAFHWSAAVPSPLPPPVVGRVKINQEINYYSVEIGSVAPKTPTSKIPQRLTKFSETFENALE